ncbi:MAG: hypothetical protein E6I56_11235 [Chloroflexi bacterium]|nr:MAG: hypothetical protein E6I56_11235 [Chloroflexota bacterium]
MAGHRPNGQASEPPVRIETREELVYLLGEACEIEHGLLCEYLYAQFSLKRSGDEGVSPNELEHMQAWETTLIDIAKQEMLHLALATNILTAVGAAPNSRPARRNGVRSATCTAGSRPGSPTWSTDTARRRSSSDRHAPRRQRRSLSGQS